VAAVGESQARRRWPALTIAALVAVLSACDSGGTAPADTPTLSQATETDEILSAVLSVYAKYSAGLDVSLASGKGDYSAVRSSTTDEYFAELATADDEFASGELRADGSTSFDSASVVDVSGSEVTVMLCRDVSLVRILNREGADVTPADRPARFPVIVRFSRDGDEGYLVDESTRDVESSICD
jgi:hypothetical protein